MSRIGKLPVTVPSGVEISVSDGNLVTVKGPKRNRFRFRRGLRRRLRPGFLREVDVQVYRVEGLGFIGLRLCIGGLGLKTFQLRYALAGLLEIFF